MACLIAHTSGLILWRGFQRQLEWIHSGEVFAQMEITNLNLYLYLYSPVTDLASYRSTMRLYLKKARLQNNLKEAENYAFVSFVFRASNCGLL